MSDLLKDIYNLRDSHVKILLELKKKVHLSTLELSNILNKDRTTIQKCVKDLQALQLISRRQKNLSTGFKYIYFTINDEMVIAKIKSKIKSHFESLHTKLTNLGYRC